jgi:ABC transporter DrrB family efflux protein
MATSIYRLRGAARDTFTVAGRDLLLFARTPEMLVFAVLQPALIVIMFRYVFGGAVTVPGASYADYLLPGIFAQTVLFGAVGTGVGLADDLSRGVVDRLRALPIARVAILGGRAVADLVRTTVVVFVMGVLILVVGFRPVPSITDLLLTVIVLLAYAFSLSWVFALVGLYASSPEGAESIGFPVLIPLSFASSAFVPVATMPDWLAAFAGHQPVTAAVDATRAVLLGEPAGEAVATSLLWSLALLAVFAPLAVLRFRRLP